MKPAQPRLGEIHIPTLLLVGVSSAIRGSIVFLELVEKMSNGLHCSLYCRINPIAIRV